jgi:hypothetical protein
MSMTASGPAAHRGAVGATELAGRFRVKIR